MSVQGYWDCYYVLHFQRRFEIVRLPCVCAIIRSTLEFAKVSLNGQKDKEAGRRA